MRGRSAETQKKRLVTWVVVLVTICFVLYMYLQNHSSSAVTYGRKSLRKFGSSYWGGDEDTDDSSTKLIEYVGDGHLLKSIPVSNLMTS